MADYLYKRLTEKVIGAAITVHKKLKSGFAEKVYQRALYLELNSIGIKFEREKEVSIYYRKVRIGKQVLDFLVERKLVVEVKKTDTLKSVHVAQVLSYLYATDLKLGLLLNFGGDNLEVKRVIK